MQDQALVVHLQQDKKMMEQKIASLQEELEEQQEVRHCCMLIEELLYAYTTNTNIIPVVYSS